ncbi:hypothetical protein [Flintibacter sp.]|uniref:hypothetical protein n=1 Tax=Flintibacter sp. TaxID=1918624 RepID=UPI003D121473
MPFTSFLSVMTAGAQRPVPFSRGTAECRIRRRRSYRWYRRLSESDEITAQILYLFEGNIATGSWIFFTVFMELRENNSLFCLRKCLKEEKVNKKERNCAKEKETPG